MKEQIKELKYDGVITIKKSVSIIYDEDNNLCAWVDHEIQDHINYSKYEKMIKEGLSFDEGCKQLCKRLKKEHGL